MMNNETLHNDFRQQIIDLKDKAVQFCQQGRYEEAMQSAKQAFDLSQDCFGKNHRETIQNLNNLLEILYAKCDYEEAELLLRDTFGIKEKRLDKKQIVDFISRWFKGDSLRFGQIFELLFSKNKNLRELSGDPSLLRLICTFVEKFDFAAEESFLTQELRLYEDCINLLLEKDRRDSGLEVISSSFTETNKSFHETIRLVEEIALKLFVNKQSIFTRDQFGRIAQNTIGRESEILFKNIEINGCLLKRLSAEYYAFYNRTFHEFLAAKAMYSQIAHNLSGEWFEGLHKVWEPQFFWQDRWIEVVRMFLGLLPRENHPQFFISCSYHLPERLGLVSESELRKGKPFLAVIYTPYISVGANKAIAEILHFMVETQMVKYIFTEGKDGLVDTSFYKDYKRFPNKNQTRKIAAHFLDEMTITGQEFCAISSRQDCLLWGIDNEEVRNKLQEQFAEDGYDITMPFMSSDLEKKKRVHLEAIRCYSMCSTLYSIINEKKIDSAVLVIGSPCISWIDNSQKVMAEKLNERAPLFSYVHISPSYTGDNLDKYRRIMNGKF